MPAVRHLSTTDARVVPWKNGRGATRELALWPEDARFEALDFDWRLSSAPVDRPGPFSAFPGYERILVLTVGEGLVLSHGPHAPRRRLRRLEPHRFRGDWPTEAELGAGPVTDFNVMVRPERARAEVQALTLGARRTRETLEAGHAFLHALAGRSTVRLTGEEEPFELGAGESLWVRELRGGEELDIAGQGAGVELLLVRLAPPA